MIKWNLLNAQIKPERAEKKEGLKIANATNRRQKNGSY